MSGGNGRAADGAPNHLGGGDGDAIRCCQHITAEGNGSADQITSLKGERDSFQLVNERGIKSFPL